jgi:sorbitol-specific phosphotransferase system component IIA
VITRKNNRVSSGDVFQANDVNSPKKRVGDGANQQLDELP